MPPKLKRRTINRVWVYLPEGGWRGKPARSSGRAVKRRPAPRNPLPEHYQKSS